METKKGMGNLSWIAILMVMLTMAVTFGCSDDKGSKDSEDKTPGVLKPGPLPTPAAPLPTEGGGAAVSAPVVAPATPAAAPAVAAPAQTPEPVVVIDDSAPAAPVCPEQPAPAAPVEEVIPEHAILRYVPEEITNFARCSSSLVDSFLVYQLNQKTEEFQKFHEMSDGFLDVFCSGHEDLTDLAWGVGDRVNIRDGAGTRSFEPFLAAGEFKEPLNIQECESLAPLTRLGGSGEHRVEDVSFGEDLVDIVFKKSGAGDGGYNFDVAAGGESKMSGYLSADAKYLFISENSYILDKVVDLILGDGVSLTEGPLYTLYRKLKSTSTCDGAGDQFYELLPDFMKGLYEDVEDRPAIAFKMNTVNAESRRRRGVRDGVMQLSAALYPTVESEAWQWTFNFEVKSATIGKFFQTMFAERGSSGTGPARVPARPAARPGGVSADAAALEKRIADVQKAIDYVERLPNAPVTWNDLKSLPAWLLKEITDQFRDQSTIKKSDLRTWLGERLTGLKNELDGLAGEYPPQPTKPEKPAGKQPTDGGVKVIEGYKPGPNDFKDIKFPAKK